MVTKESKRINRHFVIPPLGDFDVEVWNRQSEDGVPINWYCQIHCRQPGAVDYREVAYLIGDTLREVVCQLKRILPLPCAGC